MLNQRTMAFVAAVALALAPVAGAQDSTFVSRSWQNPNAPMRATLSVQVPVVVIGPNGQPQTSYQTRWVNADVRLAQEAPLRLGEVEYFRVSAYANGQSLSVHCDPDLVYHSYRGAWDQGWGGQAWVTLFLSHNGRIKNLPPATFERVTASFTTPAAPFTMTLGDFARQDNADAQTRYAFEIQRKVFLFPNKLVARGELVAPVQGEPTVVITPGCPFTQGAAEYFQPGKDYVIIVRLARTGSAWYTDGWSPEARFAFTWKQGAARDLEREDAQDLRSRTREMKFQALHKD